MAELSKGKKKDGKMWRPEEEGVRSVKQQRRSGDKKKKKQVPALGGN